MARRHAFYHPITGILKCVGWVQSNEIGDIRVLVDETFDLLPGEWRWNGVAWEPFLAPPPPVELTGNEVAALLVKEKILTQKSVDDAKVAKD